MAVNSPIVVREAGSMVWTSFRSVWRAVASAELEVEDDESEVEVDPVVEVVPVVDDTVAVVELDVPVRLTVAAVVFSLAVVLVDSAARSTCAVAAWWTWGTALMCDSTTRSSRPSSMGVSCRLRRRRGTGEPLRRADNN
jgi:hypothetical protein